MSLGVASLQNEVVRLEPLRLEHSSDLLSIVDAELWFGMTTPTPMTVDEMSDYIAGLLADNQRIALAVVDQLSGDIVGSTCFYDYIPSQSRVEIGSTFYARRAWGTNVNPSCKLLMLEYAFEQLKVARVAFRCDARNHRSVAAIKKLGAQYEGTLRHHRIAADGTTGDTDYFSVLASEWPSVRAGLEDRLH